MKNEDNILEPDENEDVRFAFQEFLKMRISIKKKATDYAVTLLMRKLTRLSHGDPNRAIAILNRSTVNNYTDLWDIKDKSPELVSSHISANQQAKDL